MEPTSNMPRVSFRKKLRSGQRECIEKAAEQERTSLNAQLPTGYGKTFTAAAVFSILCQQGRVNRLLYIVPSKAQLDQFVSDGRSDFWAASLEGNTFVIDIARNPTDALKRHRNNINQIYACTIQGLTNKRSILWDTVVNLMSQGRWMIVIDEYHHYGLDAHWGIEIAKLNFVFRFAMSATPYRKDDDSAFGVPDVIVPYRIAVKEKAIKQLECHSYVYRVDTIDETTGDVRTYTTDEIREEAGSDSADAIEKMRVRRKMRWSPKYVSPLVHDPIERMIRARIRTGLPLQVLIGAMCCSHAQIVCQQIKEMYPDLRIDWVGTGEYGRDDATNIEILKKFCPPKDESTGLRRHQDVELDILIHVAMAGEGLDSVYVVEIVHLNPANINNQNNQENGRASRFLEDLIGYVNVDSCSPYAQFTGDRIMDLMDDPFAEAKEPDEQKDFDLNDDLPDEPKIRELDVSIINMECIKIDMGYPRYELVWQKHFNIDLSSMTEEERAKHLNMIKEDFYKLRREEAEQNNQKSIIAQYEQQVQNALSSVAGLVFSKMAQAAGARLDKAIRGDVMKRINTKKKILLGGLERDAEVLNKHWHWLKSLYDEIKNKGIPSWLQ